MTRMFVTCLLIFGTVTQSAAQAKTWTLWDVYRTWKEEGGASSAYIAPPTTYRETAVEEGMDRVACEMVRQWKITYAHREAARGPLRSIPSEDGVAKMVPEGKALTVHDQQFLCLAAGKKPDLIKGKAP